MKAVVVSIGIVTLFLGLVAGAVFGLGDESLLVSPPEVVGEEFVRALAQGHVGAAREMMTRDAERRTSEAELGRMAAGFRSRVERTARVEGRIASRRRDTIIVQVRVEGEHANTDVEVPVVREYGQWAVAQAGDLNAPRNASRTTATTR